MNQFSLGSSVYVYKYFVPAWATDESKTWKKKKSNKGAKGSEPIDCDNQ